MSNLTLGIVGCGGIAQQVHLPILCALRSFSVAWVCDLDGKRAAETARMFNVASSYDSLDRCTNVDAVLVATPVVARKRILELAAKRGWHAFCEKPFAATLADHRWMLELAEQNGLVLACGFMRRFYHSTHAARDAFRCVMQDEAVRVLATDCQRIRRNPHSENWYLTNPDAGGFILETGSHLIDQALHILGPGTYNLERCVQKKQEHLDFETTAYATGKLQSGRRVEVSLCLSRLQDLWSGIRISSETMSIETALSPGANVFIRNLRNGRELRVPSPLSPDHDLTNAHISQITAFADRVRRVDIAANAEASGLQTTKFVEQCGEHAKQALAVGVLT